jgi:dipeptidyl aminopeptidase/acylaminoacyl peptidase
MALPFSVDDIYLNKTITDITCSSAHNLAACAVASVDAETDAATSAIWIYPLDGDERWQVAPDHSGCRKPAWAPDGEQLAFISDASGTDCVYLIRPREHRPRRLDFPGTPVSCSWDPTGQRLCVLSALNVDPDRRGQRATEHGSSASPTAPQLAWKLPYKADGAGYILNREIHLFSMQLSDGTVTQITDGPFDVRSAAWSPVGSRIALTRTREGDESHRVDVWLADANGHDCRRVTSHLAQVGAPVWSPDGRWIVFPGGLAEGDDRLRLWLMDVGRLQVRGLGDDSLEVATEEGGIRFCGRDSSRLLVLRAHRGVQEVVAMTLQSGGNQARESLDLILGGERQLSHLAVARDYLACGSEAAGLPMDLVKCRHDGSNEQRIGDLNGWCRERKAPQVSRRSFTVPDGDGGTESIDGWLIGPRNAVGPRPLLVDVHGGPASYALLDFGRVAYWAILWSRGWSVLALNAVGSASYGKEFADRLRGRWGELDLPQILAAIRQLVADGIADQRIAIIGKSYGGYLSALAIGKSTCFRAAVVMAPVSNIETHYGTSDSGYYSDTYSMDGDRQSAREVMRRLSPAQYAEVAVTPTLILQGEKDERCPKCQAEELFVTIKRGANPPCELVIYPGASHSFTTQGRPSHRQDAMNRIVQWLTDWIDQPLRPDGGSRREDSVAIEAFRES